MQSTDRTAPGVADTAAQVAGAAPAAETLAAARQAQAGRFIAENGHAVVAGHAPVDAGTVDR